MQGFLESIIGPRAWTRTNPVIGPAPLRLWNGARKRIPLKLRGGSNLEALLNFRSTQNRVGGARSVRVEGRQKRQPSGVENARWAKNVHHVKPLVESCNARGLSQGYDSVS